MGKPRRRRAISDIPLNTESTIDAINFEDDDDEILNLLKNIPNNASNGNIPYSYYKRILDRLQNKQTGHDHNINIYEDEMENLKSLETTTAKYETQRDNARRRYDSDEYVNPRDDRSNFVEDHHMDTQNGYGLERSHVQTGHTEPPRYPRQWHPYEDTIISFWPSGVLILAIFIIGIISLVLCKGISSRPRQTRRAVLTLPREGRLPRNPRQQGHSNPPDDEGGFTDQSRIRIILPGENSGDPPRAVTPPPPYPGSPPGANVYVNPLGVKVETVGASVFSGLSDSGRTACSADELPPPYPGN